MAPTSGVNSGRAIGAKFGAFVAACVVLQAACGRSEVLLTESARTALVRSVDSATNAFAEAERALDAERALAHIAPEFYMYVDGRRSGYDSVASQIRETFRTLTSFETAWDDLEIRPLGSNHALVTFRFSDRITDEAGNTFGNVGPTTLVWERRGVDWVIIYADADHYPTPP